MIFNRNLNPSLTHLSSYPHFTPLSCMQKVFSGLGRIFGARWKKPLRAISGGFLQLATNIGISKAPTLKVRSNSEREKLHWVTNDELKPLTRTQKDFEQENLVDYMWKFTSSRAKGAQVDPQ